MRIENVPTSNIGGVREGAAKGLPEGLKVGDTFEARVVRSESGTVTLRLEDGQVFQARLEGDARLAQGQTVRLTVSDVGEGTVRLAQGRTGDTVSLQGGLPGRPTLAEGPVDPALRPYAEALRQQGFPVSRESLAAMADLMAQSPTLSLERAAFLAGNRISQEPAILDAAAALLDGGAKVGDMLEQLGAGLRQGTAVAENQPAPRGAPPLAAPAGGEGVGPPAGQSGLLPGQPGLPTAGGQAVTTWAALLEGVLGEALPLPQGEAARPAAPLEAPPAEAAPPQGSAPPASPLPAESAAAPTSPGVTAEASPPGGGAAPVAADSVPPQGAPVQAVVPEATPPGVNQPVRAGGADLAKGPVAQVLEQLARQSGHSPGSGKLEQFARVLETAAGEIEAILAQPPEQQAAGLAHFVDSLYARIDRWSADTPHMVQKAREELFARLSLVQEALVSGESQRPQAVQQTQRLMDHLRLLGQIEQFTYVQLPVQQGERQQTAEVYIYQNKKKSRRIDPENVRILLALDLEHMGHMQAFVVIRGKDVSMRLDVQRQEWADFFRSQTVSLHSMLGDSGYRLLENRVQVAETSVTVETAMEALGLYEDRPVGLDVTI